MFLKVLKKVCRSSVIYAVCASLAALPYYGVANAATSADMKSAAQKAYDMKNAAISDALSGIQSMGTSAQDLAPRSTVDPAGKGMSVSEVQELMGIQKKDSEYTKRGNARIVDLESRYKTAGADDPEAAAYGVLKGAGALPKGNIRSDDPMFNQAKEVVNGGNKFAQTLGSCESINDYMMNERVVHEPIYEQCTQVVDKTDSCMIDHKYSFVEPIIHAAGPYNIANCGEGCVNIWIGKIGDNYWAGNCTVYEESTTVKVMKPEAIKKATLEYVKWDDYMQVYVGEPGKLELVWTGPYDWRSNPNHFPPETPGSCELSTSWERNIDVDVTQYFKEASEGQAVTFKIRTSVSGNGEGYGRLRVEYDPQSILEGDVWSPQGCIELAQAVTDGFARGNVQCVQSPAGAENGCMNTNGFGLCEGNFANTPIPGISPLCQKVSVVADYSAFYKGDMDCYTAADGTLQCPHNSGGVLDGCKSLADSGCVFIKGECTEQAEGASGNCYVYTNTYDCGYDQIVTSPISQKGMQCQGDIACLGDECVQEQYIQSTDFVQAAALLNVAQQASKDMVCTGTDMTQDVTCTLFAGENMTCKVAVGGIQDCCDVPTSVNLTDYITMTFKLYMADSAMMSIDTRYVYGETLSSVVGAYQGWHNAAVDVVKEGMSAVSEPLTGFVGNIAGEVGTFFSSVKVIINGIKNFIKDAMKELLTSVLEEVGIGTAGAVAGETAGQATSDAASMASSAVETLGTVISVVGYVYLAYQVAMLVIQTVYKCETKEFELASNKALRQCHYLGSYCKSKVLGACIEKRQSYCCYKSPLGRILQEQIREQLHIGFGSPKNPYCEGISIEDFGKVDWEKVNLDEWIAMSQEAGFLGADVNKLTMDGLTGQGSPIDYKGDRLNAADRAVERLDGVPVDDIRDEYSKRFVMPGATGR